MLELVKYVMLRDMVKSKATKRLPRPKDPFELATLIGRIATGQVEDKPIPEPTPDEVRRVMSALGKRGGPKGGAARAKVLSKERREEIAKKGAAARWKNKTS
jgi:hypothetical protein